MEIRKQVAALPIRRTNGKHVEVLLITSRETGRWVIPKGWPSRRMPDHKAAAREADEEAGLKGEIKRKPFGTYSYFKRLIDNFALIEVDVYLFKVERERKRYPEMGQRRKRWFTPKEAARQVLEPELATLLFKLAKPPAKQSGKDRSSARSATKAKTAGKTSERARITPAGRRS